MGHQARPVCKETRVHKGTQAVVAHLDRQGRLVNQVTRGLVEPQEV